mmetsp:Transcript_95116/g.182886  ORF Transcript_95116/g.182886 Transcript_95116/m.182886 type:complete len:528 (-) Transcript_95116:48-1631(-)
MGGGASAAPKLEVDGTETLVIEIGKDGEAISRGTELPIEKVQQIFVVIDPRAGNLQGGVKCLNDPKVLRKVMRGGGGKTSLKVFLLVPSTTSSKALLLNAHISVMFMLHWADQDPHYIRIDDYYSDGDAIMKAMVEEGKTVYPAEEAASMADMLKACSGGLWATRAYVHWAVGQGLEMEECAVPDIVEKLDPILSDETNALARLGDPPAADVVATSAVIATQQKAVFLTFADTLESQIKDLAPDATAVTVTEEIFELMKNDELDGELGGVSFEEAYPVMVAGPSELAGSPEDASLFVRFLSKQREMKPCMPLCAVLLDEDVEAFKGNLWLVTVLNGLIENADMVIFASTGELADAIGFFTKTKYPDSSVARQAMFQLIPFPRLHFYTLGTAIGGADLEDGEVILPAVTVGPAAGNEALPAVEKFRVDGNPFMFQGFPNHERVIPGADEFSGVSLIMPAKLLCSIFQGINAKMDEKCSDGASWKAVFDEDYPGRDDMELVEAQSNLNDLTSEFLQYLEATVEEGEDNS